MEHAARAFRNVGPKVWDVARFFWSGSLLTMRTCDAGRLATKSIGVEPALSTDWCKFRSPSGHRTDDPHPLGLGRRIQSFG